MRKPDLKILAKLFVAFFKAGTFTFAGGLAMLPLIKKDIVEKHGLMSEDEFLEYASLSQTLPGGIVLNFAVFVGRQIAGTPGMLVAGIGATFSAFTLMLVATILIRSIPQYGPVIGALSAIRAASAALILSAAFSLGRHNLKNAYAVIVMLASFMLVLLNISAVIVILAAGLAGFVYQSVLQWRKGKGGQER